MNIQTFKTPTKRHWHKMHIFNVSMLILLSCCVSASELTYSGPKLNVNYDGPVLVHNSQYSYPSIEKLDFEIDPYLQQNAANLLPLKEAIATWSAFKSIHPQVLTAVLQAHFQHKPVESNRQNRQMVFQIAAGLEQAFLASPNHDLAASRAVDAVTKAYDISLEYSNKMSTERHVPVMNLRGTTPLFGYLQPPWPRGEFWAGGGVHGGSIKNALDFWSIYRDWGGDTSQFWVSAVQAGEARVWSSCSITVIHPNGWETSYYHLDNIQVSDRDIVLDNQALSNYADNEPQALCQGGFSSGPHLHLSVRSGSGAVLIDEPNLDFSSWKHHAGVGDYDFDCETSYYTLIPEDTEVCPGFRALPNNTNVFDDLIFDHGFENL